jgi:hypothetical protein
MYTAILARSAACLRVGPRGERLGPRSVWIRRGGLAVSTLALSLASYSLNLVKSPVKVLFADDQRRRESDSAADDLTA